MKQSGGLFHEGGSVKKKRLSAFLAYPARKHARRLPPSITTVFLSYVLGLHAVRFPWETQPMPQSGVGGLRVKPSG